jgi:hypothetical protein
MLRKLIAVTAISANLTMTLGATAAFASSEFKAETGIVAISKPMSARVSVNSQIAPELNSSLTQFEKFGMRCVSSGKTPIPALITEVASESPAYRKGLQSGDGIVAIKGNADAYSITIKRDGKFYSISLSASELATNANTRLLNVRARTSDVVLPVSQPFAARIEHHPFVNEITRDRHNGVMQGPIGNCWFEASLSAVADSPRGPEILSRMITLSSQAYTVKFPNFQTITITDGQIAQANLRDPSKWASIFELAEIEVYPDNSPSRGASIGNPGVKVGLELLTGKQVTFVRPDSMSMGELSLLLDRLHSEGQPVTMASKSPQEHRQRIQPVVPNHAYSLVDFDRNSGLITLRNPLGNPGPSGHGLVRVVAQDEIQVDLPTFSTFFRFVAYPN